MRTSRYRRLLPVLSAALTALGIGNGLLSRNDKIGSGVRGYEVRGFRAAKSGFQHDQLQACKRRIHSALCKRGPNSAGWGVSRYRLAAPANAFGPRGIEFPQTRKLLVPRFDMTGGAGNRNDDGLSNIGNGRGGPGGGDEGGGAFGDWFSWNKKNKRDNEWDSEEEDDDDDKPKRESRFGKWVRSLKSYRFRRQGEKGPLGRAWEKAGNAFRRVFPKKEKPREDQMEEDLDEIFSDSRMKILKYFVPLGVVFSLCASPGQKLYGEIYRLQDEFKETLADIAYSAKELFSGGGGNYPPGGSWTPYEGFNDGGFSELGYDFRTWPESSESDEEEADLDLGELFVVSKRERLRAAGPPKQVHGKKTRKRFHNNHRKQRIKKKQIPRYGKYKSKKAGKRTKRKSRKKRRNKLYATNKPKPRPMRVKQKKERAEGLDNYAFNSVYGDRRVQRAYKTEGRDHHYDTDYYPQG